jgi:hypothetical protein
LPLGAALIVAIVSGFELALEIIVASDLAR